MTDTQRAALVSAIHAAPDYAAKTAAVQALDAYDQGVLAREATRRELDLTNTSIADLHRPVITTAAQGTGESDWLTEYNPVTDLIQARAQLRAEAGMWFERTASEVKADPAEFGEQAEGFVRHHASAYGEHADSLADEALTYVGFLWRQAASGLPQIQQTVDSHDNPAPTPLPQDVFDNFAPPVDPINEGVVGTETSQRAPQMQDAAANAAAQGQAEQPSQHSTGPDYSGSYSDVPTGGPLNAASGPTTPMEDADTDDSGWAREASLFDSFRPDESLSLVEPVYRTTAALGYTETLDQVWARLDKQAASGLDEIQQVVDPEENPKRTPLPEEVAFPWMLPQGGLVGDDQQEPDASRKQAAGGTPKEAEYKYVKPNPDGDGYVVTQKGTGKVLSHHDSKEEAEASFRAMMSSKHSTLQRQADMFGGQEDADHATVNENVANSADTASVPMGSGNYQQGRQDAVDPAQRADYLDNSSSVPQGVKDYSQGYSDGIAAQPDLNRPEPYSLSNGEGGEPVLDATVRTRVSSKFTDATTAAHPDFVKGYKFASRWTPGSQLVTTGSPEFEAGLYAAVIDRPQIRESWRAAHRRQAAKGLQVLAQRIEDNDAYTDYLSTTAGIDVTALDEDEIMRHIQSRDPDGWEHSTPSPADYDAHHNWAVKTYGPRAWKKYVGVPWAQGDSDHYAAKKTATATPFWLDPDAKAQAIAENDPHQDGKTDPEEFDLHRANSIGEYGDDAWDRYENQAREDGHPHWSKEGARKQAGTNTWLDSTDGESSPSPTGQTPINGPGTQPLLEGQGPINAPAGPSPYNGAQPYGKGVVPTTGPQVSANPPTVEDLPGGPVDQNLNLDSANRLASFRKHVQASLLASNLQEGPRA